MNTDEQHCDTIAAFRASLLRLQIDDRGLLRGHNLAHLETAAGLTRKVQHLTADAATPRDLLINRLAYCTSQLLTTMFVADAEARDITRTWLVARAELVELDEKSRPNGS